MTGNARMITSSCICGGVALSDRFAGTGSLMAAVSNATTVHDVVSEDIDEPVRLDPLAMTPASAVCPVLLDSDEPTKPSDDQRPDGGMIGADDGGHC